MSRVLTVTAGSRGIGAGGRFRVSPQNDGWDVCVNHAARAERAGEVVDSARACSRRAIVVAADVSREKDVLALFAACEDALGAPAWSTTPGSSRALGGSTISGTNWRTQDPHAPFRRSIAE
jgi:NAD(P)-dependent dehydrogenase (short-subunit alcohol dehydrogenase family)